MTGSRFDRMGRRTFLTTSVAAVGALGAVLAGMAFAGEAPSLLRGLAAGLILAGAALMKASAGS